MTTRKLTAAVTGTVVALVATVGGVLLLNKNRNGGYTNLFRTEAVVNAQLKEEEARTAKLEEDFNKARESYDEKLKAIKDLEEQQDKIVTANSKTFKDRKDYQRLETQINDLNKESAPDKAQYEKAKAALKTNKMLIERYKEEQAEIKKAKEKEEAKKNADNKKDEENVDGQKDS